MGSRVSSVRAVPRLSVICLLLAFASCEKFTALKDLENILVAQHGIAQDLREYVKNEQMRLDKLERLAANFEEHSEEALANPTRHLSNPVNAFLLIKRFTNDWDKIVSELIVRNTTEEFLEKVNEKADYFPDEGDLAGAAQALLRLQDTYQLDTAKIANGDLQGVKKSPVMTAEQSFELGRHAYDQGDYYHTLLWMQESLSRWEKEEEKTISKTVLLDYLSFAAYMQGNPRHALRYTNELLELEPDHQRAYNNKKYFAQGIQEQDEESRKKGDTSDDCDQGEELKNERPVDDYHNYGEYPTYAALCRGEDTHDIPRKHELYCMNVQHHPIFYLVPLHMEIHYFDPFIATFHDLITDTEIAKVQELATPRLARSVVNDPRTKDGTSTPQSYRVSKTAWVGDESHPLIKRLSMKSSTLANLTLETVEMLQVVNYGIGGHYEPHYDFTRKDELKQFPVTIGNRIATVIYYMTDVEAGGSTVFPSIGVKLKPRKGTCAVWYNLKENLEGDMDTRHAACPILTGTKWICNKWFHERGQEFKRPCVNITNTR